MGNIIADENGNAHLDYIDPVMKLNGEVFDHPVMPIIFTQKKMISKHSQPGMPERGSEMESLEFQNE